MQRSFAFDCFEAHPPWVHTLKRILPNYKQRLVFNLVKVPPHEPMRSTSLRYVESSLSK